MILVVDDDSACLDLVTEILTSEGYNVSPSGSAEQALVSIAAKPPELILLATRMPSMDAFEVCRRIGARRSTRDIPVIFLGAAAEAQDRVKDLRMRVLDFISKPFHREELLVRVRTHLELRRLRSELERQVAQRTAELRASNELLKVELAERRRTEQALRESEERFRSLANRAPVGIWVLGLNRELLFRNTRAFTFVGRTMPQGGSAWMDVIHPDDLPSVQARYDAALAAGRGFRIECRVRRASRYRWVLHTGIPRFVNGVFTGHIGTSVDITDLKRSHERTLHTEKLESLGALTAGIAHDFNNLIGSIFAASDMALSDLPPESPARENIERINTVATRASQLINLLTAYAGGHDARSDRIDLSLVVAEMLAVLKGTIAPNVTVEADLASGLPEVRANVTEIRQVVMNLVMNAAEALQRRQGTIRVITERATIGRGSGPEYDRNGGRESCRLIVSDTGCGMTPEVGARVFDPFYSTKCVGRGLGLAVVHGIIHSLGGRVNFTTVPGGGSTFEVLVPAYSSARPLRRVATAPSSS
jgi:PAS domain S-box-containing protein